MCIAPDDIYVEASEDDDENDMTDISASSMKDISSEEP
jgi:hypothetical protein